MLSDDGLDMCVAMLKRYESYRQYAYRDSVGKLTVGYGRNLDDLGVSKSEAEYLLSDDVERVIAELTNAFKWYAALVEARQIVLINMCFNLGLSRLRLFTRFLAAIEAQQYTQAAEEMLDSAWAKQVGLRAVALARIMRRGVIS